MMAPDGGGGGPSFVACQSIREPIGGAERRAGAKETIPTRHAASPAVGAAPASTPEQTRCAATPTFGGGVGERSKRRQSRSWFDQNNGLSQRIVWSGHGRQRQRTGYTTDTPAHLLRHHEGPHVGEADVQELQGGQKKGEALRRVQAQPQAQAAPGADNLGLRGGGGLLGCCCSVLLPPPLAPPPPAAAPPGNHPTPPRPQATLPFRHRHHRHRHPGQGFATVAESHAVPFTSAASFGPATPFPLPAPTASLRPLGLALTTAGAAAPIPAARAFSTAAFGPSLFQRRGPAAAFSGARLLLGGGTASTLRPFLR